MANEERRERGADVSGSEDPGTAYAAPAMAGRPRPAWAKPVMYQFSLQRTLAGSGPFTDSLKATSALPS